MVKHICPPQGIQRPLRFNKPQNYSQYLYKLAAWSNCHFRTVQGAVWLSEYIVPFLPIKYMGTLEKKCTFFQFLSFACAKVANSNLTNYIFLRSAIITLSVEHKKSLFFQNFRIWLECLPKVVVILFTKITPKPQHARASQPLMHSVHAVILTQNLSRLKELEYEEVR